MHKKWSLGEKEQKIQKQFIAYDHPLQLLSIPPLPNDDDYRLVQERLLERSHDHPWNLPQATILNQRAIRD